MNETLQLNVLIDVIHQSVLESYVEPDEFRVCGMSYTERVEHTFIILNSSDCMDGENRFGIYN